MHHKALTGWRLDSGYFKHKVGPKRLHSNSEADLVQHLHQTIKLILYYQFIILILPQ